MLCLDLDNFKTVNDDLGHPAGRRASYPCRGRLSECLRSSDSVARLGGDEFAVLVEGSVEEALTAADRILDVFGLPIVVDGVALTVRPSVGLTLAVADPSVTTVDDLLRQADLAMYARQAQRGGCVRSFVPGQADPYEMPERSAPATTPPSDKRQIRQSPPRKCHARNGFRWWSGRRWSHWLSVCWYSRTRR